METEGAQVSLPSLSSLSSLPSFEILQEPQVNVVSGKNCAVCFGSYTGSGRRPRSLPCGHTFCTKCITKNLQDKKITCPSCRETCEAESPLEFPINFGLENVLHEYTSSNAYLEGASSPTGNKEGRSISKKLRSLRQELIVGVEELSKSSRDINSQLHEYASQLETWKDDHVNFTTQLDDLIKAIDKESQRVKDAINEEEEERRKMELARDHLTAVSTTNEILVAVEDVNLCREDLENWIQRANEGFPYVDLVINSKELRDRYRLEPLKIDIPGDTKATETTSNEDAGQCVNIAPSTDVGLSQTAISESPGPSSALSPIELGLENAVPQSPKHSASSLSVQDKIENTLCNAIFCRESKYVQTDDLMWHESRGQVATSSNVVMDILTMNLDVKQLLKSTLSIFFKRPNVRDGRR